MKFSVLLSKPETGRGNLPPRTSPPYSRLLTFSCFQRSIRTNDIHSRRAGACSRRVNLPCAKGAISVADGVASARTFFRMRSLREDDILPYGICGRCWHKCLKTGHRGRRPLLSGCAVGHFDVFTRDWERALPAGDVAPYFVKSKTLFCSGNLFCRSRLLAFYRCQRSIRTNNTLGRRAGACSRRVSLSPIGAYGRAA